MWSSPNFNEKIIVKLKHNNKNKFNTSSIFSDRISRRISVFETLFKENSWLNIENYTLYRTDRVGKRHGGGVCIYIKKIFESYEISSSDFGINDSSIESIWCCCLVNKEEILIGCIFRPNDVSDEGNKQINKDFAKITDRIKTGLFSGLMLTGGFNYGDIEWYESLQGNVS